MEIVDSHCHVGLGWYEPVEILLRQMDMNDVGHAVLIQMAGQANNAYQADCVRRHPDRFTSVIIVDTGHTDAIAELERHVAAGVGGVRFQATTRSPGANPLAIWRAAERLGLSVSCGGGAAEFASPGFEALIEAVPRLRIVIEHLGSVNRPTGDNAEEEQRRRVFALARYPNTAMKIHGLGEFCQRAMPVTEPFPFVQPIPPLLDLAYQAFSAERLMWGSDYPPVSSREGYANSLRLPMAELAHLTDDERARVFGGTARSIFGSVT